MRDGIHEARIRIHPPRFLLIDAGVPYDPDVLDGGAKRVFCRKAERGKWTTPQAETCKADEGLSGGA